MKKYTKTHEWVEVVNGIGRVGVTDYAQKELGDIVYVELPKIGAQLTAKQHACVLESTKAAADVYAPISGKVADVNGTLEHQVDLVNSSAEKEGWLFTVSVDNPNELNDLLDLHNYEAYILAGH